MDGAQQPADEAKPQEENEGKAYEPDDQIEDEVNPPTTESNGKWGYEESEQISHIKPLGEKSTWFNHVKAHEEYSECTIVH
jgi:hypothetical protein